MMLLGLSIHRKDGSGRVQGKISALFDMRQWSLGHGTKELFPFHHPDLLPRPQKRSGPEAP